MSRSPSKDKVGFTLWRSPVGWLGVIAGERVLREIVSHPDSEEVRGRIRAKYPNARCEEDGVVGVARRQLEEYFRGERQTFDLPLDFSTLTPFTVKVLEDLAKLPYGERITYGQLALRIGRSRAARAVGRAMAANPFPVVVPCHRVVGSGGRLTGYSGGEGIPTKEWLLNFERDHRAK